MARDCDVIIEMVWTTMATMQHDNKTSDLVGVRSNCLLSFTHYCFLKAILLLIIPILPQPLSMTDISIFFSVVFTHFVFQKINERNKTTWTCDQNYIYFDNPYWLLLSMIWKKIHSKNWVNFYIHIVCCYFLVTVPSCRLNINAKFFCQQHANSNSARV